jgi:hypothetical protein
MCEDFKLGHYPLISLSSDLEPLPPLGPFRECRADLTPMSLTCLRAQRNYESGRNFLSRR